MVYRILLSLIVASLANISFNDGYCAAAEPREIDVTCREWRGAYCADQSDQQHVRPLLKMDRRVYVSGRPIEAIVGFETVEETNFVDELFNPFLEPRWPVPVLVTIFDSDRRFLGAVHPRSSAQTDMPPVSAWSFLKDARAFGRRLSLHDDPKASKILLKPGEYSLQVVAGWKAFSRHPFPEDPKTFQMQQRRWNSPAADREMARSEIITIRVIEGEPTVAPITQEHKSLFVSQITVPAGDRPEVGKPFRLDISAENVTDGDLFLIDPLNGLGRYWSFPRNHLILTSIDEPGQERDLSHCEWCKDWPAYMPVRLPSGCWMGSHITITPKWNDAGAFRLQLQHDKNVFASKEATERMAKGDNSLIAKSDDDLAAPRVNVKSNVLEFAVPPVQSE